MSADLVKMSCTNRELDVSLVIPVYNSEMTIKKVVERSIWVCKSSKLDFQIILVNDGSNDSSWEIISDLAKSHDHVVAVNMARNYGQHLANLCGFRIAAGEYVITLDDDLQNPPEEIPRLYEKACQGYDLVIGKSRSKKHNLARKAGSKWVAFLNRWIFNIESTLKLSNYRCIHSSIINQVKQERYHKPYIPGLLLKYSKKRCNITVEHKNRLVGHSGYTVKKLVSLTNDLLFNHSSLPLRAVAGLGFISTALSFSFGLLVLGISIVNGTKTPGWASIMVFTSFYNSIILLMLSVIGEYVIRILRESTNHNEYYIKEVVE